MGMFCYQCQETVGGRGCTVRGVCGKTEDVSALQDLILYILKGVGYIVKEGNLDVNELGEINYELLNGLFMTITNANFDGDALEAQIYKLLDLRDDLLARTNIENPHDAAVFTVRSLDEMLAKAETVGVLATEDEDIRSLRSLVTLGLKGMAAYTEHAENIGKRNLEIQAFMYRALADTLDDSLTADELTALVLETGKMGVAAMALLHEANTGRYGKPEMTNVDIGVRGNPAILISGHDLTDLEQLLEQTAGTGVDVYTHSEMLPAHYYPAFKKYPQFAGKYGNSWWKQTTEFESFNGPILFTTNCIVPPRKEEIRNRIFTTGSTGYPGCTHIEPDENGK